jgi:three-Cys-motif partner protein
MKKGGWTALKLLFLLSYLQTIYVPIIRGKSSYFEESYYIDLFSGCGVNTIKGVSIAGSPLISAIFADPPFDKMILVEKDPNRRRSLKICMDEFAKDNSWIVESEGKIQPDCNKVIDEIMAYGGLKKFKERKSHFLAFVDPEGMDLNWDTLEKLLKGRGDLIVLFDTTGVHRNLGMAKRGDSALANKFDLFFGDKRWKNAESEEDLLDLYIEKIRYYRNIVEPIKIKKDRSGSYYYHLIFATIETAGRSPWMAGVYAIRNKIEKNYGGSVERALQVLSNKNADLLGWFTGDESPQRSLDSF